MFKAIFQSGYSATFYRQVQHWRGKALVYLAMVLLLCWVPVLRQMQWQMNRILDQIEKTVVPQIPEIRFEQGKITTPENRPYLFHVGQGDTFFGCIIDTSGHYTSLDDRPEQMLLTRDHGFLRQRTGDVRIYDLSKSKGKQWVLTQESLQKFIRMIRRWALIVLGVVLIGSSYAKRLVQAFLLALLGLALSSMLETDLDLGELLSLAIVSMTPAMILETVWILVGGNHPLVLFFWGFLIVGYFLFAIDAAATKDV